jgi:signal transduction histidine kinase/CheY-like chemotaxis protein
MRQDRSFRVPRVHEDVDEIRRNTLRSVALLVTATGGITAWLALPVEGLNAIEFLIYVSIFCLGISLYVLQSARNHVIYIVLLAGPFTIFCISILYLEGVFIPFLGVFVVILNAAVNPIAGFVAALMSSVAVGLLLARQDLLVPVLLLLWLTAIAEWVSSRGLYTALKWAWNAQERSDHLIRQLRDNQGELNRTIAALTEATRRLQRIGHELAVARIQADRLRELKSRFAANISHELRTPLNLILGFSETMHVTPDVYGDLDWPNSLRQDVRRLYQSSRQLSELIDDVLDLSRIDGGDMPIHKNPADLVAVIHDALGLIRDLLRGRDLELRAELPDLPVVDMDQTRIRQVLVNLLNNAARFTEHGTVTVSAQVKKTEIVVSVADTGTGIPAAELGRIFDEYHQVDMSLRTAKDGVGLGLAISRRFVELHGGRMWVESKVGKGSTFYFSLPLSAEAAYRQLTSTGPSTLQRTGDECIVLVDEDMDTCDLFGRYLAEYRVIQAMGMPQACAAIEEAQPIALVINTIPDPQVQQDAVEQALRIAPPKMPVILCSIPSRSWTAHHAGAELCLVKPIQRHQLVSLLRRYPSAREVLIVDDDAAFVQLMVRYLQTIKREFRVRWAYDGEKALALLHELRPDLLLLDLVMPRMDGFELLEYMRSDAEMQDIPVVVVTATDYAYGVLSDRPSGVQLLRATGLRPMETVHYLTAILDISRSMAEGSTLTAPGVVADG